MDFLRTWTENELKGKFSPFFSARTKYRIATRLLAFKNYYVLLFLFNFLIKNIPSVAYIIIWQ